MSSSDSEAASPSQAVIWDLPVRITHWLLVVAFIGAYVTNKLGVNYFKYHAWFGYTAIVLVVFRLAWGVVGTYHARFVSFVRGPITTLRYARHWIGGRDSSHAGHNPLGAWMVLALLVAMLTQGVTGLFANDDIFNFGPLYGYVSNEFSLQLTSWHRRLFDWIAIAVGLHVVAVAIHVTVKNEPIIRAMITGRKPGGNQPSQRSKLSMSRGVLALVLAALCVAALILTIATAPDASLSFD